MRPEKVLALRARLLRTGFVEISLRGRCMEPLFVEGDLVRITSVSNLKAGDLCLLELSPGELALHRIVCLAEQGIIAKGDFSGITEHVAQETYIGKATAFQLGGTEKWVPYQQGAIERRTICVLSSLISPKKKRRLTRPVRHAARWLIWQLNIRKRSSLQREATTVR